MLVDVKTLYKRFTDAPETKPEFIQAVRQAFSEAMYGGKRLVLDLGKELPDVSLFDSEEFPIFKLLDA